MSYGLITGPELAARLNKDSKTILRWVESGAIPAECVRFFGRRPRYSVPLLRKAGWDIPDAPSAATSPTVVSA